MSTFARIFVTCAGLLAGCAASTATPDHGDATGPSGSDSTLDAGPTDVPPGPDGGSDTSEPGGADGLAHLPEAFDVVEDPGWPPPDAVQDAGGPGVDAPDDVGEPVVDVPQDTAELVDGAPGDAGEPPPDPDAGTSLADLGVSVDACVDDDGVAPVADGGAEPPLGPCAEPWAGMDTPAACVNSGDSSDACTSYTWHDGCCHVTPMGDGSSCGLGWGFMCAGDVAHCTAGVCEVDGNLYEDGNCCTQLYFNMCSQPPANFPAGALPCGDGKTCTDAGECPGGPSACSDGQAEHFFGPAVRGCALDGAALDPDPGTAACAAGWHLCAALEFCEEASSEGYLIYASDDYLVAGAAEEDGIADCETLQPGASQVLAPTKSLTDPSLAPCGCVGFGLQVVAPDEVEGVACCRDAP